MTVTIPGNLVPSRETGQAWEGLLLSPASEGARIYFTACISAASHCTQLSSHMRSSHINTMAGIWCAPTGMAIAVFRKEEQFTRRGVLST